MKTLEQIKHLAAEVYQMIREAGWKFTGYNDSGEEEYAPVTFVNLTKHAINIYDEDGNEVLVIEPSGNEARIKTRIEKVQNTGVIPLFKTTVLGEPYLVDENGNENPDFPPMVAGTIHIVSGIFRSNFDREDLYQPGRLIRNDQGQPVGCVGLSR